MHFFNIDSPFFTFMNRMTDLFVVNILFLICCIPVITIGASASAMYSITLKMAENTEGYILKSFFKAFKTNFKQATLVWIPSLLILFFMTADIRIFSTDSNKQYQFLLIGAFLILIVLFVILLYYFPLLSKFQNSTVQLLKNAGIMSIKHLPFTLCIIAITVLPPIITVMLPNSLSFVYMLWLLFGFSLTAFCNSFIFNSCIFSHYIKQDDETL